MRTTCHLRHFGRDLVLAARTNPSALAVEYGRLTWRADQSRVSGVVSSRTGLCSSRIGVAPHCTPVVHGCEPQPFPHYPAFNIGPIIGACFNVDITRRYVQEIKQATCLRTFEHDSRLSIWSMLYVFPAPFQPRVFTVLVGIFPPSAQEDAFYVIQAPIDVSSDPELARLNAHTEVPGINHASIVQGRYVATERIQKLKDGSTEWM